MRMIIETDDDISYQHLLATINEVTATVIDFKNTIEDCGGLDFKEHGPRFNYRVQLNGVERRIHDTPNS